MSKQFIYIKYMVRLRLSIDACRELQGQSCTFD